MSKSPHQLRLEKIANALGIEVEKFLHQNIDGGSAIGNEESREETLQLLTYFWQIKQTSDRSRLIEMAKLFSVTPK